MSWAQRSSLIVSLIVGSIAATTAGHGDDMSSTLLLVLNLVAVALALAAVLVCSWPLIVKTQRNAHLVWPRERLYARYPSVRWIEHESSCRAWARDLEVDEFTDLEGRLVVRGRCERCGANGQQRYIPRHHPDYGVRCPGDED